MEERGSDRRAPVRRRAGFIASVRAALGIDWFSFRDKVVIVTGGSRGLGLVLTRRLALLGAKVAILARDEEGLARAREDLRSRRFDVLAVRCDVRDRSQVQAAIRTVTQALGPIDVLINNAGVLQVGPMETMIQEDFEDAMRTHFWGPLHATLAVLPEMRKRGRGRIVNISSLGGKIASPHMLPYVASKFALVGLSEGMRTELLQEGITVTTVCPGLMRTGSVYNAFFKGRHRAEANWFMIPASLPLLSMSVESAASMILFATRLGRAEVVLDVRERARVMLLGGEPFESPILMWWNYVARSREEIDAAHASWSQQDDRFGRVRSRLPLIPAAPPFWQAASGE